MEITAAGLAESPSGSSSGVGASHRVLLEVHAGVFPAAQFATTMLASSVSLSTATRMWKPDCCGPSVAPVAPAERVDDGQHEANLEQPVEAFKTAGGCRVLFGCHPPGIICPIIVIGSSTP